MVRHWAEEQTASDPFPSLLLILLGPVTPAGTLRRHVGGEFAEKPRQEAFVFGRIAGGFEQTGLVGAHHHAAASTAVLLRLSRSAVVLSGIVHRSARMPSLRSAMQETPPSGRLGLSVAILLAIAGTIFIGQGMGIIRGSSFMVDDQRWALIGLVMDMAATGIAWVTLRARS